MKTKTIKYKLTFDKNGVFLKLKRLEGSLTSSKIIKYLSKVNYLSKFFPYLENKIFLIRDISFSDYQINFSSEGYQYTISVDKSIAENSAFIEGKEHFIAVYRDTDKIDLQNYDRMLQEDAIQCLQEYVEKKDFSFIGNINELIQYMTLNIDELADIMLKQNSRKFIRPFSSIMLFLEFGLFLLGMLSCGSILLKDVTDYVLALNCFLISSSSTLYLMYLNQRNDNRWCQNIINEVSTILYGQSLKNSNVLAKENFKEKENNLENNYNLTMDYTLSELIAEDLSVLNLKKDENKVYIEALCKISLNNLDTMTFQERYDVLNELINLEAKIYQNNTLPEIYYKEDFIKDRVYLLVGKDYEKFVSLDNQEFLDKLIRLLCNKDLNAMEIINTIILAQNYIYSLFKAEQNLHYKKLMEYYQNFIFKLDSFDEGIIPNKLNFKKGDNHENK